ncbi:MAG TPA: SLC13 family permease [Candidatus Aphodovivens avistercoris]|nr:SLC13 family permease [Candidatus Aphodovivens avistercoris]
MSEKSTMNPTAKYVIKIIIGVLIVFCFQFIPAPAPITPLGMNLIGIFFGTIYLFTVGGMLWPSFLALLALGYSGATGSLSDTVMAALGNSVMWQLIVLFPICHAISASGAAQKVAGKLMTLSFVKGKPMRIMIMLFVATLIVGILISATATIVLMFALINSIRDMMGYEKGDKWSAGTCVGCFICALIGSAAIPYRGLVAAMIAPFESLTGYPIDGPVYLTIAILVGLIVAVSIPFLMRYLQRCDFSKVAGFDFHKQFGDTKLDRRQFILLMGLAVIMIFFMVQMFVPAKSDLGIILNGFGANGIFTVVAIALAVITVDGKPAMNLAQAMKDGCPWGIIIGVGAMVAIAGQFSTEASGITAWLNMILGGALNGLPWPLVVVLTLTVTVIVTGFFSNVGTSLIMLAAIIPLCPELGINATAMAVGIVMASNVAVLSPGGSGACPLLFFNENESWGRIYKNGIPILAVFVVVASAFIIGMSVVS